MTEASEKQKQALFAQIQVSHETRAKFERYAELLIEWNEKINLVAPSTLPDLWSRHFLDSAQLYGLLPPKTQNLVDLGSGAGFPGLVLALMGVPAVHLVESIGKKARFLEAVAAELAPNVTVHHARIETIRHIRADIVTARALTALPDLLSLAAPFLKKDSLALFLKGQKADAELTEARKYWTFACEKKPSLSDPSGTLLQISNLQIRHDAHARRKKR